MPRKPLKKIFNFHKKRSQDSSQENLEDNDPSQVSRTPHIQVLFQENLVENDQITIEETIVLPRPKRAAKLMCVQSLSNIISEERCYDINVLRERSRLRASQRVANETVEQRERRLEGMRRRAAHRMANETPEQRERRLEDLRRRASERMIMESIKQSEQRLEDMQRLESQHISMESVEECGPGSASQCMTTECKQEEHWLEKQTQKQHSEEISIHKQDRNQTVKSILAINKQIDRQSFSYRLNQPLQCTDAQNKIDKKKTMAWQSNYNKEFVCRLCNYRGKKKQNITRHMTAWHENGKMRYYTDLKNCKVKLHKIDKLPNITGLNNTIVISREKIVHDIEQNYCTIYTSKIFNRLVENHNSEIAGNDDDTMSKKQKKTINTLIFKEKECQDVCVKSKNKINEDINDTCIKIDDLLNKSTEKYSDDSPKDKSISNTAISLHQTKPTVTQEHSSKIQNVISLCHKGKMKNIYINKEDFNTTSSLQNMEDRNLEMLSIQNTSNNNADTNYVRIMKKLSANMVDEDDVVWKTCNLKSKANHEVARVGSDPSMPKISEVFYTDNTDLSMPKISEVFYTNKCLKVDTKKKLLNPNPVANPKQMPKKKYNNSIPAILSQSKQKELSSGGYGIPDHTRVRNLALSQISSPQQNTNTEHDENNSLRSQNIDNNQDFATSKIKVKPLAELLSKERYMNM